MGYMLRAEFTCPRSHSVGAPTPTKVSYFKSFIPSIIKPLIGFKTGLIFNFISKTFYLKGIKIFQSCLSFSATVLTSPRQSTRRKQTKPTQINGKFTRRQPKSGGTFKVTNNPTNGPTKFRSPLFKGVSKLHRPGRI